MAEVRLSAAARADLVEIRRYSLERFGAAAADRYFLEFNRVFTLLANQPLAGVAQPELGPTVRRFTQGSHRVLYRVEVDAVRVIRVLHHARRIDPSMIDS
jgi:toxin ParE1/3/4